MRARGETRARDARCEEQESEIRSPFSTKKNKPYEQTSLFSLKDITSLYMTRPVSSRCLTPPPSRRRCARKLLRAILVLLYLRRRDVLQSPICRHTCA